MSGDQIPTLEQFKSYLSDQKDILFGSSIKSRYNFISDYFKDKDFTQENFREMLNKLRTTTEFREKCLKRSTLNKYIRVAKLMARCMRNHEFDDYSGFRSHESETKPLGDLLTDKEMREIAELKVKYQKRSREHMIEINTKYRCAFSLMRYVGTPPVDLCNLKWSNYKITHLDYYRHKTGKHMIVPLPHPLRKLFDELDRGGEYIFGSRGKKMLEKSLRDEVRRRSIALGIKKKVTPYSFRYSSITWCYMNGSDKVLSALADIYGHTVEVAKQHYQLYKDPNVLLDALTSSHPGLRRNTSVDCIKRLAIDFLARLVDMSKFEIELTITPKIHNVRHLHIS